MMLGFSQNSTRTVSRPKVPTGSVTLGSFSGTSALSPMGGKQAAQRQAATGKANRVLDCMRRGIIYE